MIQRLIPFNVLLPVLLISTVSFASAESVPVSVTKAITANLTEDIPLTGTVTSPQIATLSAAVSGLVETLHVDVGAQVEPGTLLIELDSELARIALQGARASLESAQASQQEAKRKVDEARPLVKQNNIAATEIRARESQLSITKAAVDRAMAEVNQRSAELKRHQVRAPFAGVISQKLTEQGEWVSPGKQVLELVATKNLRLDFQVPQDIYPRLNNNAKINVRFDAAPQENYSATILSTVPVNNPNARTFLLRAILNNTNPHITSGMSTSGVLQLHASEQGVLAPRDAIIRYSDGRTIVWKVNQTGDEPIVEEQPITLGVSSAGKVEIKSGLKAGDLIVTRGNEALQPGQSVNIVEHISIEAEQ
ncbi:MAG: efflux RND transporter periplasmic adaptor subunit [Cellvibrionaceae bacterium]